MVAPIITFLIAAGLGFLTWKTSTIEPFMPSDGSAPVVETPASTDDDEETADEPADDGDSE